MANCEPCNSLEVTCNHNVTIGYLKSLVTNIPTGTCTTLTVNAISADTYCPTYAQLINGVFIPYCTENGSGAWSNNVDGIKITSTAYSANQEVAKKDLQLICTALESLTITNASPTVSECGGTTTDSKTLTFKKYIIPCTGATVTQTDVDTTLVATWVGTDNVTSGVKTYTSNTSFTETHAVDTYCTVSWRGCSYSSNKITVSQNVRRHDHNNDIAKSSATTLDVICAPSEFDCDGGTSYATATLYYTDWTERHYIDTCGVDYKQENVNIVNKNKDVSSTLNATSYTYDECTITTTADSKFTFSATCSGLTDSDFCYMDCAGCEACSGCGEIAIDGNLENIPKTGLSANSTIVKLKCTASSGCVWCDSWDAGIYDANGISKLFNCNVIETIENEYIVVRNEVAIPSNNTSSPKDLKIKISNQGNQCFETDIVQNGPKICSCEGLFNVGDGMITPLNIVFDTGGSESNSVILCSGETAGCGELSGYTTAAMITDFQMTHPGGDTNKYQWDAIISSSSGARMGDINFKFKDRKGNWLDCNDYIRLIQGDDMFPCGTTPIRWVKDTVIVPASGYTDTTYYATDYNLGTIAQTSNILSGFTRVCTTHNLDDCTYKNGMQAIDYGCTTPIKKCTIDPETQEEHCRIYETPWIDGIQTTSKYLQPNPYSGDTPNYPKTYNMVGGIGLTCTYILPNSSEEERVCYVDVVLIAGGVGGFGGVESTSTTLDWAARCQTKRIKIVQEGRPVCNKCSNMGLTLEPAYSSPASISGDTITVYPKYDKKPTLEYSLICGNVASVSFSDSFVTASISSTASTSEFSPYTETGEITLYPDFDTLEERECNMTIHVDMASGTVHCSQTYTLVIEPCGCIYNMPALTATCQPSEVSVTKYIEFPCNITTSGFTLTPYNYSGCCSAVTVSKEDDYGFNITTYFNGSATTATDTTCSYPIKVEFNGENCSDITMTATQKRKDEACDECSEIFGTFTGGTSETTVFDWDEFDRCEGMDDYGNPQAISPWSLCIMKKAANFTPGCQGGNNNTDYIYSATTLSGDTDKFGFFSFYDIWAWPTVTNTGTSNITCALRVYRMVKDGKKWVKGKDDYGNVCYKDINLVIKPKPYIPPTPTPSACTEYGCDCVPGSTPSFTVSSSISTDSSGNLLLTTGQTDLIIGTTDILDDIRYTGLCEDTSCLSYGFDAGNVGNFEITSIDSDGNIKVKTGNTTGTFTVFLYIKSSDKTCTYYKNYRVITAIIS